ncbi:MAG: sugar transferase [Actinomycetota bacterium]|nr:sugar transferase [Actinomycetota bacterium]
MDAPQTGLPNHARGVYARWVKPVFDVAVGIVVAIVLSPIALVVAIAILVDDGRPVLFRQQRTGRDGSAFMINKFRSMPTGVGNIESAEAADLPVTRVGAFIRRFSLDEVPQLINVLNGSMSFVGPRPPLPSQVELIEIRRANGALALRPGLTGLAQLKGYDFMPTAEKALLDGEYARSISFTRDMSLLFLTVPYLLHPPPRY